MTWIVEHGNDNDRGPHRTPVENSNDLDALLDRLDAESRAEGFPAYVRICPPVDRRPVLSLGLGRDEFSFLTYNLDHVHGDHDGGKPAAWMINDEWSELPPGFCVDAKTAREAAREFVTTGQRPTNVDWVEQ
jgi:hypothetical protein